MAEYSGATTTIPNPLAPRNEKKSKPYILSYAKTAYNQYYRQSYVNNNLTTFKNCRKYAAGKQSVEDFRERVGVKDTSWMNVDLRPITMISKLVDISVSDLMNQNYAIQFEALDPESKLDETKYRNEIKANMILKKLEPQITGRTGIPLVSPNAKIPEEGEDFETFYLTEGKRGVTLAMEQVTNYVLRNNNFEDDVRRKILRDLVVINHAATMRYYDQDRNIKIKYVDFCDLVYPYSKFDDFNNIPYIGLIEQVTVQELGQMTNEFTEKQLYEIAKKYQGQTYNNPNWGVSWGNSYEGYYNNTTFIKPYYNFNIPIMRLWFKGINKEQVLKRTNKGHTYIDRKTENANIDEDTELVGTVEKEYLYQGSWVVGSDYLFNYGECENMERPKVPGGYSPEVKLPIEIIAPDIYDMQNKSIVEKAIPLEDQLNLLEQKIQQVLIMAKPAGNFINEAAFDEMASTGKGKDDKEKAPNQYDMYAQTGSIAGRATDKSGNPIQFSPIQKIDNSYWQELNGLIMAKNARVQEISDVMGYNEATNGRMANPETPVGTQQFAVQATTKSLQPIYSAHVNLVRRTVEGTANMIQLCIKENKKAFVSAIGAEAISAIEHLDKIPMATLGINIRVAPNERERAWTMQLLQKDIETNVLASSDVIRVEAALKSNPDLAVQVLVQLEKKRAKDNQQRQLEIQQENANGQQQSAKVASQMKREEMAMELEMFKQKTAIETEAKMAIQKQINEGALNKQYLINEGTLNVEYAKEQKEIAVTHINKDGKLGVAVIQSQTKLADNEQKHNHAVRQNEQLHDQNVELLEKEPKEKVA